VCLYERWNKQEKAKEWRAKLLAQKQAYRDLLDEPWRGDFFGVARCR
jgi:hypothetical protein